MAIKEVLCDNDKERHKYEEALIAITVEESLKRYCQRIGRADFWGGESELLILKCIADHKGRWHDVWVYCQRIGRADFWGGESELLVLSKLCRQPIMVYIPEHEICHLANASLKKRGSVISAFSSILQH
nr:OTU domain-containing protein At3g57810 [Tanacetum cinerariifolium]